MNYLSNYPLTVGTNRSYGGVWRTRYSDRGNAFAVWRPPLPRIKDSWLESVVYLYRSREAAESGGKAGGTGFVVGVEWKGFDNAAFPYVVTNKHVVEDGRARTIRVNTTDGGVEIFETEVDDWERSATDDLAVIYLPLDQSRHKIQLIQEEFFVTKEVIQDYRLGPGDEVCILSRFVDDTSPTNSPIACFGNVSMIQPTAIKRADGAIQESIMADMRSIPGFSGSPVLVFIPRSEFLFREIDSAATQSAGPWLLGVNWGHIPVWRDVAFSAAKDTKHPDGIGINSPNSLAGIVPAWKLKDLLYSEKLIMQRKEIQQAYTSQEGLGQLDTAEEEPAQPEFTKEDFENALKKASRKLEPDK